VQPKIFLRGVRSLKGNVTTPPPPNQAPTRKLIFGEPQPMLHPISPTKPPHPPATPPRIQGPAPSLNKSSSLRPKRFLVNDAKTRGGSLRDTIASREWGLLKKCLIAGSSGRCGPALSAGKDGLFRCKSRTCMSILFFC